MAHPVCCMQTYALSGWKKLQVLTVFYIKIHEEKEVSESPKLRLVVKQKQKAWMSIYFIGNDTLTLTTAFLLAAFLDSTSKL